MVAVGETISDTIVVVPDTTELLPALSVAAAAFTAMVLFLLAVNLKSNV